MAAVSRLLVFRSWLLRASTASGAAAFAWSAAAPATDGASQPAPKLIVKYPGEEDMIKPGLELL